MSSADLVLGIDSSTQSTKAIAWDRNGRLVAEGRAQIAMAMPQPNWFEQDPEQWWDSLRRALQQLWTQIEAGRIAGIAISNQRETLAFLDENGLPLRPAMTWLDERGRATLQTMSDDLGSERLHRISGKPADLTPAVFRLAWLRDNEPELHARTALFADVQTYLNYRLTGVKATSWASADPLGFYDIQAKSWSEPLLSYLNICTAQCPDARRSGTLIDVVSSPAAEQTGLRPGTPVFAGAGDGQCAALATHCTAPGYAYINLGTAIVMGVWSADCALAKQWRTLISASGEGYILEAVERTGAFLINWFVETFTEQTQSPQIFSELEHAASHVPIGAEGLITLPYWSGCMNPHWDSDARGCFIGLSGSHSRAHIYRSVLEGLTLAMTSALQAMKNTGINTDKLVAIGGGTESALWLQMLADAMQQTVWISDTKEASNLGAAMIAACGVGWYGSSAEAAHQMGGELQAHEPNPENSRAYQELMSIQESLYSRNADVFRKLKQFQPT